ncbi:MAG: DNA replication/repair protein RecF [Pseudomonadota bacterium]
MAADERAPLSTGPDKGPGDAERPAPAAGPQITRLTLSDFRNHRLTDITFDAPMVALTGPNGAGKTNILEAISLLSPGRGLRRARYADMIRSGAARGFSVAVKLRPLVSLELADEPIRMGTGVSGVNDGSREIRIDGVPARTSEVLSEHLSLLWLTPAMDGLFTGGASDRRRFFDRLVLALHPQHGRHVNRFESAMRARNKLFDTQSHDRAWFEGVEAEMASTAHRIDNARQNTLSLLRNAITEARVEVSEFPYAELQLTGFEDASRYQERLESLRERDRAAGRALEGPHRVDLEVVHGPKQMSAKLASTGEQKALLIGLVLAQARLIKAQSGRAALLLLDEIAAHLDQKRRRALFDLCFQMGGQTFMTGTDTALFEQLPSTSQRFDVEEGNVTSISTV